MKPLILIGLITFVVITGILIGVWLFTKNSYHEPIEEPAVVESITVLILESFPVQVQVQVTGYLEDSCTTLNDPLVARSNETFTVSLTRSRPSDAMCAAVITPYEITIPLEVEGLSAGTYTVDVNDHRETFALTSDNQLPENEE